jgi:hypothetical protein
MRALMDRISNVSRGLRYVNTSCQRPRPRAEKARGLGHLQRLDSEIPRTAFDVSPHATHRSVAGVISAPQ